MVLNTVSVNEDNKLISSRIFVENRNHQSCYLNDSVINAEMADNILTLSLNINGMLLSNCAIDQPQIKAIISYMGERETITMGVASMINPFFGSTYSAHLVPNKYHSYSGEVDVEF